MDPDLAASYRAHWFSKDILVKPLLAAPVGKAETEYTLLPAGVWEQSEIYNDYATKFDLPHVIVSMLHNTPERYIGLSLKTSRKHGRFNDSEVARAQQLIPHIKQVLILKDRVEGAGLRADTLSTCLDKAQFGVIVLDAKGNVCEASDPARALFRLAPRSIGTHGGKLWVCPPAGAELEYWIRNGRPRRLDAAGFLKIPNVDSRDIGLVLSRVPVDSVSWLGAEPRWIALLFDLGRPLQASPKMLARDLGISAREAEVAALLMAGHELNAVAAILKISVHTVRAHVKSIFARTGLRSQAELILRIASGPAMIRS